MVKKRRDFQETATLTEPITIEETLSNGDPRSVLDDIKNYDGVIGYILKNTTSASVDLKDPSKIVDYAILSSSALDVGNRLSELFHLGEAQSIMIDGKNDKMLCFCIGEHKASIFVEKTCDVQRILKRIHAP